MQLTNERLLIAAELLRRVLRETSDMPAPLKLAVIRLARRVGEEAQALDQVRQEMILRAAECDPDTGEPVVVARQDNGAVTYRIRPDARPELERQWREVLAGAVEIAGVTALRVEDLVQTSVPADVVLGLLELGLAVDPAGDEADAAK